MSQQHTFELRDPITPYVCSTPADFVEEREFIRTHVFPQLAELCRSRGSHFSPCDFSWRDRDNKMETGVLLKTQLDAAKRCSPFFIAILGETYGPHRDPSAPRLAKPSRFGRSQPEGNDVDWLDKNFLMAAHAGHSWVLEDAHQSSSITELEITQANFLCDNLHSTLYYRQLEHIEDKLNHFTHQRMNATVTSLEEGVDDDHYNNNNNNNNNSNGGNNDHDNDDAMGEINDIHEDQARQDIIHRYSSESEYAKTKIRDLKQRLVNRGIPVKYFRSLEELGRHVLDDWREIIDMLLPPLIHDAALQNTVVYNEWIAQQSFVRTRTQTFVSTNEVEEMLQELSEFALTCTKADASTSAHQDIFPQSNPQRGCYSASMTSFLKNRSPADSNGSMPSILMLGGDRGVGKSAILSRWVQDFRSDYPHIYLKAHFVSASAGSANLCSFMEGCINDLREQFLLSEDYDCHKMCVEMEREAMANFSSFGALCHAFVAALSLGPCVIVVDGLNELTSCLGLNVQEVKEFSWLPEEIPSCCKFILTTTKSDISHRSLSERGDVAIVNCPSSLSEAITNIALVREYAPNASKLLGGEEKVRSLGSLRVMQSTLGSRVISNEILRPQVYQNFSSFMDQWADIWSLRNCWVQCVQSWVQNHSWLSDNTSSEIQFFDNGFDYSGWVADSLCLIALSRNGLAQTQILSILKTIGYEGDLEVKDYEWHQFRLSAGATLHTNADGRIVFSHSYLREVAEYLFFKSMSSVTHDPAVIHKSSREGLRQAYHSHLARHFSQQTLTVQTMEELPWHLMLCGDVLALMDFLTDSGVLLKMLDGSDSHTWLHDLKLYWAVCVLAGHRADHSYLSMMHAMGLVDAQDMQKFEEENDGEMTWSPSPRIVISTPQPMDDAWEVDKEDDNDDDDDDDDATKEGSEEEGGGGGGREDQSGDGMSHLGSKEGQGKEDDDDQEDELNESFTEGIFVTQNGRMHSASMASRKTSSKAAHGAGHHDTLSTMTILGWRVAQLLRTLGHPKAYKCMLSSLVKYMQQNYPLSLHQHLLMSQCHLGLGLLLETAGQMEVSEMEYRLALQSVMTADDMDDDMTHQTDILYLKGSLLCCYGNVVLAKGDLFEAEELLKESLECIEDNSDCYVLRSNVHQHLGQLRALQHDFPRAEACLRQSAQHRSQWVGRSHPLVADVFVELARILTSEGNTKSFDADQAEGLYREALRVREGTVGPNDISVATVLFELGSLLAAEQSQMVKMEAQKLLRRSLDIRTTELGTTHPQTAAVQQTLTHLDVALKLGQYEFGQGRPKEGRSRNAPFSAMTFRDSDLSVLKNRIQSSATPLTFQDPMRVRAMSRDDVMRHNRPDSIGSVASERFLAGPVGDWSRPRLLSRDRNRHGFDSGRSSYHNGNNNNHFSHSNGNKENNNNTNTNNNNTRDFVVLDSLDSKGRRLTIGESDGKNNGSDLKFDINGSIGDRVVEGVNESNKGDDDNGDDDDDDDPVVDDAYIDSYVDYTNMPPRVKDKRKQVQVRPSSAPRKMFQRFQNIELKDAGGAKSATPTTTASPRAPGAPGSKPQTPLQRGGTAPTPTSTGRKSINSVHRHRRHLWSGRSNASSVATTSGHLSRCSVPDRFDISHSTARNISGPHSSLQALLGDAQCPRPPSNHVHHRSAWYHVPGRYPTIDSRYPHKRNQKTENAKDIDAFLALKTQWEKKKAMQKQLAIQREYFKKLEEERLKKEAEQTDENDYQYYFGDKLADMALENKNTNINNNNDNKAPQKSKNKTTSSSKKSGSRPTGEWFLNKEETPRLMISGLDKVPESRYNFEHVTRPTQGHGVKFKEPIVVG